MRVWGFLEFYKFDADIFITNKIFHYDKLGNLI